MVEESDYENRGAVEVNNSTSLARVVVRQIIESGVTDVVISPGSRNAPLSLAFFAAAERNLIKIHVRIDERTAAFFALGVIKATGRPVAIVCTSGTAVANYHPAVLEAHHTNAPLLVLTADRPAMLRKTGANQTTEQARLFGRAVRYFADVSGSAYPMPTPTITKIVACVHSAVAPLPPIVFTKRISGPFLNCAFTEKPTSSVGDERSTPLLVFATLSISQPTDRIAAPSNCSTTPPTINRFS